MLQAFGNDERRHLNFRLGTAGKGHKKVELRASYESTDAVIDIDTTVAWFQRSIFNQHGQVLLADDVEAKP